MAGDIKIRRRGDRYGYDFYHDGERFRQSGYTSHEAAKKAGRKALNEVLEGAKHGNKYIFQEEYKGWVDRYKGNKHPRTYGWYINALNIFDDYFKKPVRTKDLTKDDYQAFINHYAATHSKESTRKLNNCLKAGIRNMLHNKIILVDPTFDVEISGAIPAQKDADKFMTLRDFSRVKAHAKDKESLSYLVIYLLIVTGGRFGEVINMNYSDIKDDAIHLPGTKTDTSDRTVEVNNADIEHVHKVLSKHERYSDGSLFGSMSHQAVQKTFKRILDKLNIPPFTLHALRHTHVSFLLSKGVSIHYISKRAGHANIGITLKVYSHLLEEAYTDEVAKTLDALKTI